MTNNPFINRGPVSGKGFFNRKSELNYICQMTLAQQPQSISIVSRERMGATSLLFQFCRIIGPKVNPSAKFIYIDFQSIQTRKGFIKKVLKKIGKSGDSYEEMEDVILDTQDLIVLCMDNFGKTLVKPKEFDIDFFDFMRSLTNRAERMALITVTSESLYELDIPHNPEVGSPFKHIFQTQLPLENWADDDQIVFIKENFSRINVEITDDEIAYILTQAGKTPYYLMVFLDHYFNAKTLGNIDHKAIKQAYQKDVSGIAYDTKKKSHKKGWPRFGPKIILTIVSLIAIALWMVFGLPRQNIQYACMSSEKDLFQIILEHPKYLAFGDIGRVGISVQNTAKSVSNLAVIIDFVEPVQLLAEFTNKMEFEEMAKGEQQAFEIQFRLIGRNNVKLAVDIALPNESISCVPVYNSAQAIIFPGPVPYLMKLWVWMGTTGPIGWIAPIIFEWFKKGMTK